MVGSPMPRLTYWPSAMSCAARQAIWRRVSGVMRSLLRLPLCHHDAIDENPRRCDCFGIERAELGDLAHLRDRDLPRHCHNRVEVARRFPIGEIAPAIAALRLDEREIARQRLLEHIKCTIDLAQLLAVGEFCVSARAREEATDASAGSAHALRQRALRHELDLDLLCLVELVDHLWVGGARIGAYEFSRPPRFQQRGDTDQAAAGVVADDGQVARAELDHRLDERDRLADRAEAAAEKGVTVLEASERRSKAFDALIDH